jgi:GMP synthase-like glutamine amidotransferase
MRLHYLQHVPFEDLGFVEDWAKSRGHQITGTMLFDGQKLPAVDQFDWLIIMGGPMNIYEEKKYPWLSWEKKFIHEAIVSDKIVLGICLGAQLMAESLGARVLKNEFKEVGWHPVKLTAEGKRSNIFKVLPGEFLAFHWHGDAFGIPEGAIRTAESVGCANQAFQIGKAVGLQFHLESTMDSIEDLIENCIDGLAGGKYVQRPEELLADVHMLPEINRLMKLFLDNMQKVLE